MKQINSGAEAIIYLEDNIIIKKRIPKKYRITEIDEFLRKSRTRTETKILEKIPIAAPKLIKTNKTDTIEMEYIRGEKVRDVLDKNKELCIKIGKQVSKMHDASIIHGDLTTSNMILHNEKIYFIDFGLSFFSRRIEDKAVDIHLFRQALDSKHHTISEKAFKLFLQGYKKTKDFGSIEKRFEEVEMRGRYKKK